MATKNTRTLSPSQKDILAAEESARGWRETVESIVVAIVLALLFRTFLAEAFVIPTGSMATTLMGDHKDVQCPQCKHWYQAGSAARSVEGYGPVIETVCPMCRCLRQIDPEARPDDSTFTGDRILVNKFAYEIGDPQRWDVIVFRYPGNAKQNYIKRLIGLPNETVRIRHGDIYARDDSRPGNPFVIQRKSADKLLAMLQDVHDTNYLAPELTEAGWPSRWQPLGKAAAGPAWKIEEEGRRFTVAGGAEPAWLRYQNLVPGLWRPQSQETLGPARPTLIRDFNAYNVVHHQRGWEERGNLHWVGDLAVEADVQVESNTGFVLLDLVEGGRHYECRIDIATGQAKLSIDGGRERFDAVGDEAEAARQFRTADTAVRGPGSYRLQFANCDDRLYLWVNCCEVPIAGATFTSPEKLTPYYRHPIAGQSIEQDWGDLAPAGVGSQGAQLVVSRLKVLRDIYFVAIDAQKTPHYQDEYQGYSTRDVHEQLANWEQNALAGGTPSTALFDSRVEMDYPLAADQFLPLGDNSPASRDGRLWEEEGFDVWGEPQPAWREPFVRRELLTGKAFAVYWPHCWYVPVAYTTKIWPLTPYPARMGRIK